MVKEKYLPLAIVSGHYKIKGAYGNLDRLTRCGANRLMALSSTAVVWNILGRMLSGSLAYQILRIENPVTIANVRALLKTHPWYESRWREQFDKLP